MHLPRYSNFLQEDGPSQTQTLTKIHYPPNVVRLGCSIPKQFVSKSINAGNEIKVHVSDVRNPSRFRVILKSGLLDVTDLMDYIQEVYFDESQSKALKILEKVVSRGMFCVALYEGEYNRGLVKTVNLEAHQVEILFVDYGTVALIDSNNLYFLLEKFSFLPRQAIKAKLADVRPCGETWSGEETRTFSSMVGEFKELTARIVHIDRTNKILRVILKEDENGESIGDAIIRNKLHDTPVEDLQPCQLDVVKSHDVIKVDDYLPYQFDLNQIREKQQVTVLVTKIFNPTKFWVTPYDSHEEMKKLMQEMHVTYSTGSPTITNIPEDQLKEGMLCVATNGTEFCRVSINRVKMENHQADIFFIDHGRNCIVDFSQLHFMYERFARVPRQAFKATLSGIAPLEPETSWSSAAIRRFSEMVNEKPLIAKISSLDTENRILKVVLIDDSADNRKCINNALIQEKLASLDY